LIKQPYKNLKNLEELKMRKGTEVKVTLRHGEMVGKVTKKRKDIIWVMSEGTEYKFYQGPQKVERLKPARKRK
jgi:predicted DNA-binding antitoxin AbrB/MazE fold protein